MKKTLLATALATTLIAPVQAEIRLNGFANLVAGVTSSEDSLYGYTDSYSFSEESMFALQASGDINDKMTATVQLLARGEDNYDVEFEWAYLTYQLTDNASISAGRLRLPLFRYSASLDVGYSYHWINAPHSVYDVPFNNIDGVRFDYSTFAGDWEYNFQVAAGNFENEVSGGISEGKNVALFSAEATYEWFKIRGVYGFNKASFRQQELDAVFAQLETVAPNVANFLEIEEDTGTYSGIGIEIDQFDWFVSGEYVTVEIEESFTPKDTAWYVTGGMRVGKWTPSLTYENFDSNEPFKGLDELSVLPAEVQQQLRPIVVGTQLAFIEAYDVYTATVRYDYDTNVAFKADISHYSDELNPQADTTLLRLAVNYVF